MKPADPTPPIDRLLARARQAPPHPFTPLSSARAHRILAAWRESRRSLDAPSLVALWRWGVASAFGVSLAVLTATWNAPSLHDDPSDPYFATEQAITQVVQSAWFPNP